MKTLAQIEPRTPISSTPFAITSAGSYYLTTNLVGTSVDNGITIMSGNVTLKLNGSVAVGPLITTYGLITNLNPWANFPY